MSEHITRNAGRTENSRSIATKSVVGAAWLLMWRVLSRSLGMVSTLILARVLVPADFGIVAMATTFAAAVDAFSQLGIQDALIRHVGDGRRLFNTAFTLQVSRAVVTSCIVAGLAPTAAWWFNEPRLVSVLLVLAFTSMLAGFENVGTVEFRRAMRYDMQFRLLFLPRLLQVCVTIPLALVFQSYWALLSGIVVVNVSRVALGYWIHSFRPRFGLNGWRELAGFSFWTWASCLASVVWDRVDPFLLGPAVGSANLGLYLIGGEMAMLPITELLVPVSDALFAGFASAQKQGSSSLHHAPLVATILIMVVVPMTITVSCASGYVVAALLGPKWSDAREIVAVMAWLCAFSPVTLVCNAVLVANGHVRRNFIGKATASVVKVAVFITVVSITDRLQIIAISMTACFAIESAAYALLLKGLLRQNLAPHALALLRILIAAALVMAILHQTGLGWQPVTTPSLQAAFICTAIGGMVVVLYVGFLAGLWAISKCPAGPETRLLEIAGDFLRPLHAWFESQRPGRRRPPR